MQHFKFSTVLVSVATIAFFAGAAIAPMAAYAQNKPAAQQGGVVGSPAQQGGKTGVDAQQGGSTDSGGTLINPLKFSTLEELIDAILSAVITLGTYVLILMLMVTGFKFVAARGNEEAIRSARTALMWTIIGGLILLGAKSIQLVLTATVQSITP